MEEVKEVLHETAHHFDSAEQEFDACKTGMWLFLVTEIMLFGGLFSAYVFLRVGVDPGVDNPWPWGVNVQNRT